MSLTIRTVALAAATTFAVLGGVGAAEAGGKHKGLHKFHFNHGFNHGFMHRPRVRIVIGGGGCGHLYKKWRFTGSGFWKHKYYDCLYHY